MPLEIERKFLVVSDTWRQEADAGIPIRQGYLTNAQHMSVRVRICDAARATLTLKLPRNNVSRLEYEYDIPLDEAEELMQFSQDDIVAKRRYHVQMGGLVWQIDVFEAENDGLVVAEIELDSEDQDFDRPGWLGSEVTSNKRYQNSQLARQPFCTWLAADTETEKVLAAL